MLVEASAGTDLGGAVEILGTEPYEQGPIRRQGQHSGTAVRAVRSPQVGLADGNLCFFLCSLVPLG